MRQWTPADGVSEQAPGVFFVEGPASNWVVVRDATGFILIDSGYPADLPLVLAPSASSAWNRLPAQRC